MHVGVAKTGTTYVQRILEANRGVLRSGGLLYPGRRRGAHFVASIDLRGLQSQKYSHLDVDGRWDALATDVRGYDGNAVISHETFARCSRAEITRVRESFPDARVRIVLTVRDLGRQIPAVWQETLKNRGTNRYGDFLEDIFVNTDSRQHAFFWRAQDVARVVARWADEFGASNVVVVTVPPPGAAEHELWNRFARAIELPPVQVDLPPAAANVSLGPAEAELLRHVNAVLPADLPWPTYVASVKHGFAESSLARRTTTRLLVPPAWHEAVGERAASMVTALQSSGCQVVGDLGDLSPRLPLSAVSGPDDLAPEEMLRVAAEVIRDAVILRGANPRSSGPCLGVRDGLERGVRALVSRLPRRLWRGA